MTRASLHLRDIGIVTPGLLSGLCRVDQEKVFLKTRCLAENLPLGIQGETVAVKEHFIIATNLVDEQKGPPPAPHMMADQIQPEPRLSVVEWRGRNIDQDVALFFGQRADRVAPVG